MEERLAQYQAKTEARIPLDFMTETLPAEVRAHNKVAVDADQTAANRTGRADPFADESGLFRKRKARIRKIAFVQQIDEMDCGAASLGMVCRHFGRTVSLARIRQLCHTSTDGTSLKAICRAATELGLAARALKVSLRNLPEMPLPAIIHWESNHWMVLFEVNEKFVRVADPASGLRRIPRNEFQTNWSGYAALFDYTDRVRSGARKQGDDRLGAPVPREAEDNVPPGPAARGRGHLSADAVPRLHPDRCGQGDRGKRCQPAENHSSGNGGGAGFHAGGDAHAKVFARFRGGASRHGDPRFSEPPVVVAADELFHQPAHRRHSAPARRALARCGNSPSGRGSERFSRWSR